MTIYNKLTKKELRIIGQEFKFILSDKGLVLPQNSEDLKKCNMPFGTKLKYKNRDFYLTKSAEISYRNINKLIISTGFKDNYLSYGDYFFSTKKALNKYFVEETIPSIQEFLLTIENYLLDNIQEYTYVSKVDGLELENFEELKIGNKIIKYFKPNVIPSFSEKSDQLRRIIISVKKDYKKELIITGKEIGSESKTEKKFFENSNLLISILRIYSFIVFKDSISSIGLGLINDYGRYRGNPTSFRWQNTNSSTFSYKMHENGRIHKLSIENKMWGKIRKNYKLNELSDLIEKENRNELEEAIIKALYWLGEAQKDNTLASSWIKLWSSLECFFSIKKKDVTKSNINGITVLLTIGAYEIDGYNDYKKVKSMINKFYDKRSRIVHRSEYNHIKYDELTELSYIVSFVIINVMVLLENGYTKLLEIKKQIDRLSNLEEKQENKIHLENEFIIFNKNYEYTKINYDSDGTEYIEVNNNIEKDLSYDERNYIYRNTLSLNNLNEDKYFRTTRKINPEYFI